MHSLGDKISHALALTAQAKVLLEKCRGSHSRVGSEEEDATKLLNSWIVLNVALKCGEGKHDSFEERYQASKRFVEFVHGQEDEVKRSFWNSLFNDISRETEKIIKTIAYDSQETEDILDGDEIGFRL